MTQARSEISNNTRIGTEEAVDACCESPFHHETPDGMIVCRNCGLVIDTVKTNLQKRAFTADEKRQRIHSEVMPMYHQGWRMRVTDKGSLSPKMQQEIWRLVKINNQQLAVNRGILYMSSFVEFYGTNLDLPRDVCSTATRIMKEVSERKVARGRSIKGMAAAAIYEASKIQGHVMFAHDLYDNDVNSKTLMSHVHIVKKIADDLFGRARKKIPFKYYISVLAGRMGVQMDKVIVAQKVYDDMIRNGYRNSKDPRTVIAALLFTVCKIYSSSIGGLYPTQKIVSSKVGITEVSLRSRVKDVFLYCKIPAIKENVKFVRNFTSDQINTIRATQQADRNPSFLRCFQRGRR